VNAFLSAAVMIWKSWACRWWLSKTKTSRTAGCFFCFSPSQYDTRSSNLCRRLQITGGPVSVLVEGFTEWSGSQTVYLEEVTLVSKHKVQLCLYWVLWQTLPSEHKKYR